MGSKKGRSSQDNKLQYNRAGTYDPNLNPIAAEVSLTLEVLTYDDFRLTHPGYSIFLAHQIVKETMAAVGSVTNTASLGDVGIL